MTNYFFGFCLDTSTHYAFGYSNKAILSQTVLLIFPLSCGSNSALLGVQQKLCRRLLGQPPLNKHLVCKIPMSEVDNLVAFYSLTIKHLSLLLTNELRNKEEKCLFSA